MRLSALLLLTLAFVAGSPARAQDLHDNLEAIKEAVAAKDIDKVITLAAQISKMAKEVGATPAPAEESEKAAWKEKLAFAKDVDAYSEYALTAVAVEAKPEQIVKLGETLEAQNPKSKYLDGFYGAYLAALNQTGAAAKIPAIADKAIANLPDNEDLLLIVANNAMQKGQLDRAAAMADRLVTVMSGHGKPEGISQADWEKKRALSLGQGYYIAGMTRFSKNLWYLTDKNLRAALPYIKGNQAMNGAALFALGVANYQMGKAQNNRAMVLQGATFSEQAAAIPGQFQQQAYTNAAAMKREAAAIR